MADFLAGGPPTSTIAATTTNGTSFTSHSRDSSMSSERSQGHKENASAATATATAVANVQTYAQATWRDSGEEGGGTGSDHSSSSGGHLVVLRDGGTLGGESRTDGVVVVVAPMAVVSPHGGVTREGGESDGSGAGPQEVPPRQPVVAGGGGGSGTGTGTARHKVNKAASSIPEVDITIPNDGSLVAFSVDAMASFFRSLRLDDRLVSHLHRNGLDGRKFGRLKDTDLDNLKLNNPVIAYFRDRTAPAAVDKKNKKKQRLPFVL
ncbi:uncharacterized protein LOC143295484 [Babylonia areolata]|uniref:uncharacterized protein LOC143295484 n=1 Tax=Babylonia areolata TaxID=304850 RepID=UPI003FD61A02